MDEAVQALPKLTPFFWWEGESNILTRVVLLSNQGYHLRKSCQELASCQGSINVTKDMGVSFSGMGHLGIIQTDCFCGIKQQIIMLLLQA